jgi:hypothetical protein
MQHTFIVSTQILPLFVYEFHPEQFIVLALLFNVQSCLCAIAVSRHKYRTVGGGGNCCRLNEWL